MDQLSPGPVHDLLRDILAGVLPGSKALIGEHVPWDRRQSVPRKLPLLQKNVGLTQLKMRLRTGILKIIKEGIYG
jgi:hypothetical protein